MVEIIVAWINSCFETGERILLKVEIVKLQNCDVFLHFGLDFVAKSGLA